MATLKRQAPLGPNDTKLCEAALHPLADIVCLLARQAAQEVITAQASDMGSPKEENPR